MIQHTPVDWDSTLQLRLDINTYESGVSSLTFMMIDLKSLNYSTSPDLTLYLIKK